MYILYTKIEIQTNTHIPITPSPHRKHSSSQCTLHTQKKNEVGIPYPLLTTANEADSAYVCDSKRGYSIGLSRLIDSNRIDSSSQPINRFKTPESIH